MTPSAENADVTNEKYNVLKEIVYSRREKLEEIFKVKQFESYQMFQDSLKKFQKVCLRRRKSTSVRQQQLQASPDRTLWRSER